MTKRRPTMEVDEDHLKDIMAGGLGRPKQEQPKPQPEQPHFDSSAPLTDHSTQRPKEEESEIAPTIQVKEPVKQTRKKRETSEYENLFLERKASVDRRQTYIDADLHKKISSFLPVIAGHQFSVPAYISNILAHHLELHKEDINELYERKSKKPF